MASILPTHQYDRKLQTTSKYVQAIAHMPQTPIQLQSICLLLETARLNGQCLIQSQQRAPYPIVDIMYHAVLHWMDPVARNQSHHEVD